jgi:hypothetical protein
VSVRWAVDRQTNQTSDTSKRERGGPCLSTATTEIQLSGAAPESIWNGGLLMRYIYQ